MRRHVAVGVPGEPTLLVREVQTGQVQRYAVRERMQFARRPLPQANPFLRWLLAGSPSGRHTWSFLADAGGRPRTAFAIILSL